MVTGWPSVASNVMYDWPLSEGVVARLVCLMPVAAGLPPAVTSMGGVS